MSILGNRVERIEDPRLLTSGGVYTDDLDDERLTGAAYVTFVRSSIAHGRLMAVDVTAARAAPGVLAVVTADDLRGGDGGVAPIATFSPEWSAEMAQPVLADGVVRFVGEAVAAVVTERRSQGEDAAELVEVDIEPMAAVVDPRDAAADGELLFPAAGTNTVAEYGGQPQPDLFADCEVVVAQEFLNQRLAPAPLEVRACAAAMDDDRLVIWTPSQGAQGSKAVLTAALGLDPGAVRVITPDVGGGFGAKSGAEPEHVVLGWLARRLGRPVRWVETRSENLVTMPHGRAQVQQVTIGGRRDGTLLAYAIEVLQDAGAYPKLGGMLPALTCLMAPGVYDVPRLSARARAVVTNTTPISAYRGAGRPEATAAIERAVDMFAAEIGMDPAEVRRRNVVPPEAFPFQTKGGALYDSGAYAEALDLVLEAGGYAELRAEQAERRARGDVVQLGIGLSAYVEITGAAEGPNGLGENATVEVHADGTVTVLTGTSPHGQGHATAWAMLVSDQLGIGIDKITVLHGDTDLVPEGGGTVASRSLQQGGAAVHQATAELVDVARRRAAELLEANPDDLVVDTDRAAIAVAGTPASAVTFAELAASEPLSVATMFSAGGPTFPFGAHLAAVEVDTETGKVVLRRVITVDDAGTILNPLIADGQRHGGIAQGVAQALFEEVTYDADGNPQNSTFADYAFVSAAELPSFELVTMETPTPMNPLGAKGIGEAGTIGATPAVHNAVVDALAHLGIRHIDMPATPRRVWEALTAR
ncbi:MAG TPA: xanthine dehydrogenase family protein molybdopterin-binding subunit [Streptosporangiaceae bacterium]|jgi:carbon-monoxide dehydrogenase large subunit